MEKLCQRDKEVLFAVVQSYIEKPDPVGSRFVTRKYAFRFSPATIRNIMADLEESGFLAQPYTSAGRVPTDKGFRFYVDSLRGHEVEDIVFMQTLRRKLEAMREDMNELLRHATQLLAEIGHNMVFAVPLVHDRLTLNRVHLYRYRNTKTVVVLLTDEGIVRHRIIDSDFGLSQRELNRISDFMNSEFGGQALCDIRSELMKQISRERDLCNVLVSRAMAICSEALSFQHGEIIMAGISELLSLSGMSGRITEVVRAIEDKRRMLSLLESLSLEDGVRVVIGSENPDEALRDLSVVTAAYRWGGALGSVGIIGPTSMDYSRIIPLVDMTARFISESLSK